LNGVCFTIRKLSSNKEDYRPDPPIFHSCFLLNISVCLHSTDNDKFVVTLYNPTSQPLTTFVRLPVQEQAYSVRDYTGAYVILSS
jgi:lysosomal alpha-mannosidase